MNCLRKHCLRLNGHALYLDRYCLAPKQVSPTEAWAMGRAHYMATGLCFDDRAADIANRLHELLPDGGSRYSRCRAGGRADRGG